MTPENDCCKKMMRELEDLKKPEVALRDLQYSVNVLIQKTNDEFKFYEKTLQSVMIKVDEIKEYTKRGTPENCYSFFVGALAAFFVCGLTFIVLGR